MEQAKKKKIYTEETLNNALANIKEGMSIRAASKTFHVPKTTLIDKMKHKYKEGATPGAPTVLSMEEEENVVQWILYLGRVGFPVTKGQLLESVAKIVASLKRPNTFKNGIPGRHWYEGFLTRHRELSTRISQNLTQPRASITEQAIRDWFDRVKKYLTENKFNDVLEDPRRVFNCDESAFFLAPKEKQVIVRKGSKKVYTRIQNDRKECLTVLVTVSADGNRQPPLVLMPYKRVPPNIYYKMPKNWSIGRSDSGWMTGENFYEYITNVFHPWLMKCEIPMPVVLFLDGHSSHLSLHLSEFCKEKGIILTALLPNSTHRLQPLDVAVFRPLKISWKNQVQKWRLSNNGEKLKREDFSSQMDICLSEVLTGNTIPNGFRTCGLYPFSVDNFDFAKLIDQVGSQDTPRVVAYADRIHTPISQIPSKDILLEIEKRINPDTLMEFRLSQESWTGKLNDESLFFLWKKLKIECTDNSGEHENSHNDTLNANLPATDDSLAIIDNITFNDSVWLENDNMLDLEVQADGTLIIPSLNSEETKSSEVDNTPPNSNETPIESGVTTSTLNAFSSEERNSLNLNSHSPLHSTPPHSIPVERNDSGIETEKQSSPSKVGRIGVERFYTSKENEKENENPCIPTPLKGIPTPFKKSLFWPGEVKKTNGKKVVKKLTPTVATSEEFIEYQRRIDAEKKKKESAKAERTTKKKEASAKAHISKAQKKNEGNREFEEGDYVIVTYEQELFPGIIIKKGDEGMTVKTMTMSGKNWKWPERDDVLEYSASDIVSNINPPGPLNKRGVYSVPEIELIRNS